MTQVNNNIKTRDLKDRIKLSLYVTEKIQRLIDDFTIWNRN